MSVISNRWAESPGFAWDGSDAGGRERVPVVEFDFEAVFRSSDGDAGDQPGPQVPRVPLDQILSPRELQVAFGVAREMLRRASPLSRAARAKWRDPAIRKRMTEGIRRATRTPEARRERSESALRAWRLRDRQENRELMRRLWRERRAEFLTRMQLPEYRKQMSEIVRARWAVPAFRERMLSLFRGPEARRRTSLGVRRYLQEHPEARQQRSETQRRLWRDLAHRNRLSQSIRAGKAAARAAFH